MAGGGSGGGDYAGRACYLHRDLARGAYGGDVACFQQYLHAEGYLSEEPSGYFGTATEEAVVKWQLTNKVLPAKGFLGYSSRVAYARSNKLPTSEQLQAIEAQAEVDQQKDILETCTTIEGIECCHRRSVKKDVPYPDKMHICQSACQIAMSEACEKVGVQAFPASQQLKYKSCQSMVSKNCSRSCKETIKK
eukprot:SM000085S23204  [mRNA]  locus=s85:159957:162053:+ [translate_table: standard]